MRNADWPVSDELLERLTVIEVVAQRFTGVREWEHLLVDLTALLRAEVLPRPQAVAVLLSWAASWPWGAIEVLEFSMRGLQWSEIRQFLVEQAADSTDFRHRNLAAQALEAFEPDWPGGQIYRTYDPASGVKTYVGFVWADNLPMVRIRLNARNSTEARAVAEAEHGPNRIYSIWNEEDAERPRGRS